MKPLKLFEPEYPKKASRTTMFLGKLQWESGSFLNGKLAMISLGDN